MTHIFISYSKKDITFARYLRRLLEDEGFGVWMDETRLVPSDRWWPAIERNIETCAAFIVIMSPNARTSRWVEREILYAEQLGKPIFPVLLAGRGWPRLADIQYEDMRAGTEATLPARLVRGLAKVVPREAVPSVPPPLPGTPLPAVRPDDAPSPGGRTVPRQVWAIGAAILALIAVAVILALALSGGGDGGDDDAGEAVSGAATTAAPAPSDTPRPTPPPTDPPLPVIVPAETQFWLDQTATVDAWTDTPTATAAATNTATATPDWDATYNAVATMGMQTIMAAWTDTPEPTGTPEPTDTPRPTDTPQPTDTDTPQPTDSPQPTDTLTHTPTPTPTYTLTATPTETLTNTPTRTATHTLTPTMTETPRPMVLSPADIDPNATPLPAGSSNAAWTPVLDDSGPVPLVYVPSGCFMMGSTDEQIAYAVNELGANPNYIEDEQPAHKVCLSAFWIGQTEVTNAQYRHCVEAGACDLPGSTQYYDREAYADHPVVYVSWNDASAYVEWLSEETGQDWGLPTEAQWEYAARGPEASVYPWGDDGPTCEQAQITGCEGDTVSVGSLPGGQSWAGALEMSGNVWEWVADWYDGDYYGTLAGGVWDPAGPADGTARVVRGGSWDLDQVDARAAFRHWYSPLNRYNYFGFRVVCARPMP